MSQGAAPTMIQRASTVSPAASGPGPEQSIVARLGELAAITDEPGRLTRLYLSPAHRRAADLVAGWMREAQMSVRVDAVANVAGRYEGAQPGAPTLLIGSHIDTVRDAGRFDGNLGVVAAIEAVRRAASSGQRFPFAIEVVAFGDEEGVRFPSALGGSRALAGTFDPKSLDDVDENGVSRRDALIAFGCDGSKAAAEARTPANVIGYLELHIEQGPVLEAEGLPVGIVTAINGASRGTIEVAGMAGHAGTVPMRLRQDALAAAAEMIVAIERRARQDDDLVATVGQIEVAGGARNTIPGQVHFTLDLRSPSDAERQAAVADIEAAMAAIARSRGVEARLSIAYDMPAAPCDAALSTILATAVESCGVVARRLPSGAGHDAMAFHERIPFAMLFVRCRGGISHNPAEFADAKDIGVAARVLAAFLDLLQPASTARRAAP